jgi:CHAT domain-containing protein/tetratricopeptide (TPR) repeat protein
MTQSNLGAAYWARIRGDKADNLEKAIAAHAQALTVRTREASPQDWAVSQNNLGNAYFARIRGARADNLEKAIAAHEQALTVRTREASPLDWAATQANLAAAYFVRTRGDRAENLEKAIAACEQALTVYTREALPLEWATVQGNLGGAFFARIHGAKADNLEKAIDAYEQSLTVRTRKATPLDWAFTQTHISMAYFGRTRGDRAENVERAIAALEQALTVHTREALPLEWARTQYFLGVALSHRFRGNRADNQERGIAAYEQSLTVYTRETSPLEWAATQHTLGLAYRNRISGSKADNVERAIAAHQEALKVRTREGLPREWASTQNSLGTAYAERIQGTRAENLEKAILAGRDALAVYTREAFPRNHMSYGHDLGRALLDAGRWREAGVTLDGAREAFLHLFGQGIDEVEARDIIALAGTMFAEAAFAAAQVGETEKALALATEGRARMMAVTLKLQTLNLAADKRQRLEELRVEIRSADRAVEAAPDARRGAAIERLVALRQELLGLVKDADAAEAAARGSALAQARALAGKGGAVVVPIVTRFGGKLLIVTSGSASGGGATRSDPQGLILVDLPELTTGRIDGLVRGADKTSGWLGAYRINYLQGPEFDRRWPEWTAAIANLGPQLWDLLGARLQVALRRAGVKPGARLVWLPTGSLGILPLGLAQDPSSKRRLGDHHEIVYAPSLDALTVARNRLTEEAPATLALVVNPTGDLGGTENEGRLVASHFPVKARAVLERSQATPDAVLAALKGKSYWHFASHGTFSWDDARRSGLYMSGRELLTVGRLLEADGLGRPRLVVLSACETGLYDINRNPDEFIGLPGTFTALGAAGVLGTLWPVSDAATALLIAKFYDLHMDRRLLPPAALRRAQAWVRQATDAQLRAYARVAAGRGRLERRQLSEIEAELSEAGLTRSRNSVLIEWGPTEETRGPDKPGEKRRAGADRVARPYAHPYFWAGFIHTGL